MFFGNMKYNIAKSGQNQKGVRQLPTPEGRFECRALETAFVAISFDGFSFNLSTSASTSSSSPQKGNCIQMSCFVKVVP